MAFIRRINHENTTDLELDKKTLTFGRDESNDVSVDKYQGISRNHCGFTKYEDGVFTVTDYGSRNGTYVNGKKIFEETKLKHRDEIIICEKLQFVFINYESEAGKKELAEIERKKQEEEERKKKAVVVKGDAKLSEAMSDVNVDLDEGKDYKDLMNDILKGTKKEIDIPKKNKKKDVDPNEWVNKYE